MATHPISIDMERMSGTACFTGTRVPIQTLFDFLKRDRNISAFLAQFPSVKREMVEALFDSFSQDLRDAELNVRRIPAAGVA